MFTSFFNMTAQPFPENLKADEIMKDERISQGLARLIHASNYSKVSMIIGEDGSGKSSLLKLFKNSLEKKFFNPVYIHFTNLTDVGFLKNIVASLGEVPTLCKEKAFYQIMKKVNERDITTLLLIDEAHHLKTSALIDLCLLISSGIDDVSKLKIVLAGDLELKTKLKRSSHDDLRRRISVYYHISPFTEIQTHKYINYHLKRVNVSDKIFNEDVKTSIHQYARGVPARINNIATYCLLNAASQNSKIITNEIFSQTIQEIEYFL